MKAKYSSYSHFRNGHKTPKSNNRQQFKELLTTPFSISTPKLSLLQKIKLWIKRRFRN